MGSLFLFRMSCCGWLGGGWVGGEIEEEEEEEEASQKRSLSVKWVDWERWVGGWVGGWLSFSFMYVSVLEGRGRGGGSNELLWVGGGWVDGEIEEEEEVGGWVGGLPTLSSVILQTRVRGV